MEKQKDKMPKSDRLAGLTEEEYQLYLVHEKHGDGVSGLYLTIAKLRASDARKKKLLEKIEWVGETCSNGKSYRVACLRCKQINPALLDSGFHVNYLMDKSKDDFGHAPDCALEAELEGGE